MHRELAPGYTAEFDTPDKDLWQEMVSRFEDANLYQTWPYEEVRSGPEHMSHLLLKREGKVVAAAQARIARVGFGNLGIAYLRWAPLWRLTGNGSDVEVFTQALRALRNEYVSKRHLVLRIRPVLFDDQSEVFHPIFQQEGFVQPMHNVMQQTLLVDLDRSVEELRRGLHEKWRYNLKLAERNEFRVVEGTDDELFDAFLQTYKETHQRKRFLETSNVNQFRKMQRQLPDTHRMRIWVAFHDDVPAAGVICSCIGKMGLFLFGGTSHSGLNLRGSYLLQWRALNWLKDQGARSYNLGGINRNTNPGTYRFKAGLCGKNGREARSVGVYDAYCNPIVSGAFQCLSAARVLYRVSIMKLRALTRGGKGV